MRDGITLAREGAAWLPPSVPASAFCQAEGFKSEFHYKEYCKQQRRVTYHMHIGLNSWQATHEAIDSVLSALAEHGHRMDRYGLCLDRSMGLTQPQRAIAHRETGPVLADVDWPELASRRTQPHLGDFMIGTPAGLVNAAQALAAGITTIGNLGQYFAFDIPGAPDDQSLTEITVRALGLMAAARTSGALVHSYLDDGPAMQFSTYGAYVGWAVLEKYVVETLLGARLAHSFGGLVSDPRARAVLALAIDDIHDGESIGSMIYGNTVDYGPDRDSNLAILASYLTVDIATQLHRPTGHAVHPVPLTEATRIPSAEDIIEVQLLARQVERETRRSHGLFDWPGLERDAAELARYGRRFAEATLRVLRTEDGVQVDDPVELLLSLRRCRPAELEARLELEPPPGLPTWKAGAVRHLADQVERTGGDLRRVRAILAVLEVHDVVRDALAMSLPRLGAEVIVLPPTATPAGIARAAIDEDANVVIVGTYNGNSLSLAQQIVSLLRPSEQGCTVVFGGVLNQNTGQELPIDVRDQITDLGVRCVDHLPGLVRILCEVLADQE